MFGGEGLIAGVRKNTRRAGCMHCDDAWQAATVWSLNQIAGRRSANLEIHGKGIEYVGHLRLFAAFHGTVRQRLVELTPFPGWIEVLLIDIYKIFPFQWAKARLCAGALPDSGPHKATLARRRDRAADKQGATS